MSGTPGTEPQRDNGQEQEMAVLPRQLGWKLLWRLLIYHTVLATVILIIAVSFPSFFHQLPIGGVGLLKQSGTVRVESVTKENTSNTKKDIVNSFIDVTSQLDRLGYARRLIIVLIGVWLLMLPVSWVNKGMHQGVEYDHSLDETTLILPGVVASIVLIVQHSLALAFSLAGIIAGVHFRRALQDTYDALFILVSIGVGIAAGVNALEIAAVLSVFFTYATLYIAFCGDGMESHYAMRKKLMKRQKKSLEGVKEQTEEEDDVD